MVMSQASTLSLNSSSCTRRRHSLQGLHNSIHLLGPIKASVSCPKPSNRNLSRELNMVDEFATKTNHTTPIPRTAEPPIPAAAVAKLHLVLEAVADRVEMHVSIGEQRDNWNSLLLNSINVLILAASVTAVVAAAGGGMGAPLLALKLSATLLFSAAAGMMTVVNKIQPSQLAEEQRNAARLFKQLRREIEELLATRESTQNDIVETVDKVLALDRAYPLPLLGVML